MTSKTGENKEKRTDTQAEETRITQTRKTEGWLTFRFIPVLMLIVFLAGCATLPDWAVDHAVRIGRAIVNEYTQEKDEVAVAILEALEKVQEAVESFREIGVAYQPEPDDYRLHLHEALSEAGLDQETIKGVVDEIFPPPGDVQALALQDYRRFDLFLKRVVKEIED